MLDEKKGTCCHKCGHVHVKGTACPKPYLTGERSCARKQNESIEEVGDRDSSYENIMNYVNSEIDQNPSKAAELFAKIYYAGEGNEDLQQREKEKYLKLKTDPITLIRKIQNFLSSLDKSDAREIEQELGLTVDELSTMKDFNSTEHQTLPADHEENLKLENEYGQPFVILGTQGRKFDLIDSFYKSGETEKVALDLAKKAVDDAYRQYGNKGSTDDFFIDNQIDIVKFKDKDIYTVYNGDKEYFIVGPQNIGEYEAWIEAVNDKEKLKDLHTQIWAQDQDYKELNRLNNELHKYFNKANQQSTKTVKDFGFDFSLNEYETEHFCEACLAETLLEYRDKVEEAEYRGRKVTLGKPFLTPGGPKKRSVYVKNAKGNVVKVNFGDPNMRIKKSNPKRRKSYRARHHCDNPGPRWKANYWSCKAW